MGHARPDRRHLRTVTVEATATHDPLAFPGDPDDDSVPKQIVEEACTGCDDAVGRALVEVAVPHAHDADRHLDVIGVDDHIAERPRRAREGCRASALADLRAVIAEASDELASNHVHEGRVHPGSVSDSTRIPIVVAGVDAEASKPLVAALAVIADQAARRVRAGALDFDAWTYPQP